MKKMDMIQKSSITNAALNLTQRCNLVCSYCFTKGKTNSVLPFSVGQKAVDFLLRNAIDSGTNKVELSFWGGEPLMEWELLKKIVLYAEEKKSDGVMINFGGTTNGTLLTEDKFDFLEGHQIFFLVSLDGPAAAHDIHRRFTDGTGSHKTIVNNLEKVLRRWPFYRVRMSLVPERVNCFCEDTKFLFDLGFRHVMFSPVYDMTWTDQNWTDWEAEAMKLVDYISAQQTNGIELQVEHFESYMSMDQSKWPCGAGRFYAGINSDGSIWPCSRFNKFGDKRPWHEKEMCLGHLDYGIRPDILKLFAENNVDHCLKNDCTCLTATPCHGGCYAANFDLTGDINTPSKDLCAYVHAQQRVSAYYAQKVISQRSPVGSCVCNNMCYAEGTPQEVINITRDDGSCFCNQTQYTGPTNPSLARPLERRVINPMDLLRRIESLENRVMALEKS